MHELSAGIDDRAWQPSADQPRGRAQDILFLANLEPRKGIPVCSTFAEVARALPAARLVVAGDGPLAGEVSRRARRPPSTG